MDKEAAGTESWVGCARYRSRGPPVRFGKVNQALGGRCIVCNFRFCNIDFLDSVFSTWSVWESCEMRVPPDRDISSVPLPCPPPR
uniref:Uncharacterized protein n=1 Tax=Mycena chlorophos TaxID=658473 RepID=A0ABQ0M900_MYCCL|nr:predicted protein [Mycena chlorophos]